MRTVIFIHNIHIISNTYFPISKLGLEPQQPPVSGIPTGKACENGRHTEKQAFTWIRQWISRIRHFKDRFSHLEGYESEDFRKRFRMRKESIIRQKQTRSSTWNDAAHSYWSAVLCNGKLSEGCWRSIWYFYICCVHNDWQGIKSNC